MKFNRHITKYLTYFVILSVCSMLNACGKTGDLYLPDTNASQDTPPQKKDTKD